MLQLRSWLRQERASLHDVRWRTSLLLGAGFLVLLVTGEVARRILTSEQLELARQSKDLELLRWQVSNTRRTSQDWAHWNDSLAFVEGRNPKFPSNDMATTALLSDGAVMAIFSASGKRLAIAGATPEDRREGSRLSLCLQDLEGKRRFSGTTHLDAICPGDNQFYVGSLESISDNTATYLTQATLAYLAPMRSKDNLSRMANAMNTLASELLLDHDADAYSSSRVISPELWTSGALPARVKPPHHSEQLAQEILALTISICCLIILFLGLRVQWVLGQRHTALQLRRQQRLSNHSLRRSEQALIALIDRGKTDDDGNERAAFASLLEKDKRFRNAQINAKKNQDKITERIETLLTRARSLALQNPLTGLPNRSFFLERLNWELRSPRRHDKSLALLFINIDKFKQINETYGHTKGDEVLRQLAADLNDICAKRAFLAHLNGDEFALILNNDEPGDTALHDQSQQLAVNVIDSVQQRTKIRNDSTRISLSIAIAIGETNINSAEELMRRCDQAMRSAKQGQTGHIATVDLNNQIEPTQDYRLFTSLQEDINQSKDRFRVVFQPIVDSKFNLHKVEALARWHNPDHNEIGPENFFNIAERYRLIHELGNLILEKALHGFNRLRNGLNRPNLSLALNISPSQLERPEFAKFLLNQLNIHGISPGQLTLEVTESAVVERSDSLSANLLKLRQAGIYLALDDFGTGFSSLRLLLWLRPDELKIDKSFVLAATQDPVAHQIVLLLQQLAQTMRLTLVAEGVEDHVVLALLQEAGINRFQGYLFAKAQSPEELVRNTASQPPTPAA